MFPNDDGGRRDPWALDERSLREVVPKGLETAQGVLERACVRSIGTQKPSFRRQSSQPLRSFGSHPVTGPEAQLGKPLQDHSKCNAAVPAPFLIDAPADLLEIGHESVCIIEVHAD